MCIESAGIGQGPDRAYCQCDDLAVPLRPQGKAKGPAISSNAQDRQIAWLILANFPLQLLPHDLQLVIGQFIARSIAGSTMLVIPNPSGNSSCSS